jgi:LasA protease
MDSIYPRLWLVLYRQINYGNHSCMSTLTDMRSKFCKSIYIAVATIAFNTPASATDPSLTEQDLIYNNEEMLNFSIETYVMTYAPHLLPYAESISHWSGYSSISPKILLALMEHQSSIISIESSEGLSQPFKSLSDKFGFSEQTKDVSNQLAELHYARKNHVDEPLTVIKLLSSKGSTQVSSMSKLLESFSLVYYRLFPKETIP